MKRVFIDTSVLFSACISPSGAPAKILKECKKELIKGIISRYVIGEAKKNVGAKLDQQAKQRLSYYLLQARLEITIEPTRAEIDLCKKVISPKDASILAAALKSKSDILITRNINDFMKPQVRTFVQPLEIMTPRSFVNSYF